MIQLPAALIAGAAIGAGSSLLGGAIEADQARSISNRQMDLQKEFAQYGIQWKVADAKAAGIHPLAALGANTVSYSPISVGTSDYGLRDAGQHFSKMVTARYDAEAMELDLEGKRKQVAGLALDNIRKIVDLQKDGQTGVNRGPTGMPVFPNDMMSSHDGVQVVPKQIDASNMMGTTAGAQAYFDRYLDDEGFLHYKPNQNLNDLISDSFPDQMLHYSQQFVNWLIGNRQNQKPEFPPPPGYDKWEYYRSLNMWRAVKTGRGKVQAYKVNKDGSSYKKGGK